MKEHHVECKQYSEQFKQDVVKLVAEQGYSVSKAAESLGVSQVTMSKWKKKYEPVNHPPNPSPANH